MTDVAAAPDPIPDGLSVSGIPLRPVVERDPYKRDQPRVRAQGRKGEVRVWIEPDAEHGGWKGGGAVMYRWTSGDAPAHAEWFLPRTHGATVEACAATLSEIVDSLRKALAS